MPIIKINIIIIIIIIVIIIIIIIISSSIVHFNCVKHTCFATLLLIPFQYLLLLHIHYLVERDVAL